MCGVFRDTQLNNLRLRTTSPPVFCFISAPPSRIGFRCFERVHGGEPVKFLSRSQYLFLFPPQTFSFVLEIEVEDGRVFSGWRGVKRGDGVHPSSLP